MNSKNKVLGVLCLVLFLAINIKLSAQKIILDAPVKAGELVLFQSMDEASEYYYLPNQPHLTKGKNGQPQFSFLKYINDNPNNAGAIQDAGGLVHAVVSFEVNEDQLSEAKRALRRINSNGTIVGPVIYKSGAFTLVTSFTKENGEFVNQVVGLGNAPLIEGSKAAISMLLTKKGADVLWASFKTPAPDISFSFEMEVVGYRKPVKAWIKANFDQVYEHRSFQNAIAGQLIQAEINTAFDDLRRTGAIEIYQEGDDKETNALITTAYNKLTDIMFESFSKSQNNLGGQEKQSMLDRASRMYSKARSEAKSDNSRIRRENREVAAKLEEKPREKKSKESKEDTESGGPNLGSYWERVPLSLPEEDRAAFMKEVYQPQEEVAMPTLAIASSFKMKTVRQSGKFEINLNKSYKDKIINRFDENIGQIDCETCFHRENVYDDLHTKRTISVMVDNMNQEDFSKYINFVTLVLQKEHADGEITNHEITIDQQKFKKEGNKYELAYGWEGDDDREEWLTYQYKTAWSFYGSDPVVNKIKTSDIGAIPLIPPIQRRKVLVDADPERIEEQEIRMVTLRLFYDFGAGEQQKQVTLLPRKDQLSEEIEFMLLRGKYDYEYEITWIKNDGSSISSGRKNSNASVLIADTLPN